MITLNNITKTYEGDHGGTQVLKGVSLSIPDGAAIAVLGASGAGKSSLLHIMGGLDSPTTGRVDYDGIDLAGLSEAQRSRFRNEKIGFVFQFHHLLPDFTALENVMMPLLIRGLSFVQAREKARLWLDRVELTDRAEHRPSQMSGGEQQRTALARALVGEPKYILADEPTGNLDSVTAEKIFNLLLMVNKEWCPTLVVVTHNEELSRHLDKTIRIIDGKIQS